MVQLGFLAAARCVFGVVLMQVPGVEMITPSHPSVAQDTSQQCSCGLCILYRSLVRITSHMVCWRMPAFSYYPACQTAQLCVSPTVVRAESQDESISGLTLSSDFLLD